MQKHTISLRYLNLIHTSVIILVGNSDDKELKNMSPWLWYSII